MPLRDDLLKPIEGPNPCGEDLSYDAVYDEIQEARREEDELPQGEWERPRKTADYREVVKLASEALATRTKDLTLAAWLTEALLFEEGFTGLRQGLALLHALLDGFWEHVHPRLEDEDPEFRAAPLNWVGDHLTIPTKSVPLTAKGINLLEYGESLQVPPEEDTKSDSEKRKKRDAALKEGVHPPEEVENAFAATPKAWYKALAADLQGSLDQLDALDRLGREKFGEMDAPSYLDLRKALGEVQKVAQGFLDRKLELEPDPVEPEPLTEGAVAEGGAASGEAAGAGGPAAISVEPASRQDAASRVAAAARYLRREDPRNPAPYLMLRGLRWGELRVRGSDLDPRLLEAPPTPVRSNLKGLLLDGKWDVLLESGEEVMATTHGRGWLDLQRYVLTACANLGAAYDHVASAIRGALAALLTDLPQLLDMTLMDDTPTANAETQAWLQREVIPHLGGGASEEGTGRASTAAAEARKRLGRNVYDLAMSQVRQGQPQKGIQLLMQEAEEESSARGQFILRSHAANIMVDSGLQPVALPILEQLVQLVEKHNLEEWEAGELIAKPLGLLYRCLDDASRKAELHDRICRLDPLQAISFSTREPDGKAEERADSPAVDSGPAD